MSHKKSDKLSTIPQLIRVQIQRLPNELRTAMQVADLAISGGLCDSNSLKLVRLAGEKFPERSCLLVVGFAFPPTIEPSGNKVQKPSLPREHAWIRFDGRDHDPTWEQTGWPVETLRYYEALSLSPADLPRPPAQNSGGLPRLHRLAEELGIDFC
ncbi:hypothetical protein [Stigmatella hybrida]|uniref:hypothetical protein n=1 Tax=Stigmatella hybrida TaxID=394097 RepID=UPI001CDAFE81|nr:hypothetical protein [Stigmatella hybrida]